MTVYILEKLIHLYPGYQKAFQLAGYSLLLIQQENTPYIIENRCPHMDVPLTDAEQIEGGIRCRAHGIEFLLSTGKSIGPLENILPCLTFFPVVYDGNNLAVELE